MRADGLRRPPLLLPKPAVEPRPLRETLAAGDGPAGVGCRTAADVPAKRDRHALALLPYEEAKVNVDDWLPLHVRTP